MTREEWPTIKRLLIAGWPSRADGIDDTAWISLLSPFAASDVADAVRAIAGRGGDWMPRASEIVGALRQRAADPSAADAYDRAPDVRGEAVLHFLGVATAIFLINGRRRFYPEVDTLLLETRKSMRGKDRQVVGCAGSWDVPDGPTAWESWTADLIGGITTI